MIFLFSGDNSFEVEQRVRKLIAGFDGDVEKNDGSELTLEQLPDLLAGVTLFSAKRLIIIKNASENKPLWTTLSEWLEKGVDNEVIFIESHIDKRTKTYKWLEKHATVFTAQALQAHEALQWLETEARRRGVELAREVAQYIIEYVGTDQWRLSSELEKLQLSEKRPTRELVRELIEPTPQATAFELLDAAFNGRREEMQQLLGELSEREDPYQFFGLLASQVYALIVVASSHSRAPQVIAKDTGLHPYVVQKMTSVAKRLSVQKVQHLIDSMASLDEGLKSRSAEPWVQIRVMLQTI